MKHKMVSILVMSNKFFIGMKMLESKVLNNTTIIVRFKGGVKHLIHQEGVLQSEFFQKIPDEDFERKGNDFQLMR